jgi:hypothetical protein
VYVIPDTGLAVANLRAFVCTTECDYAFATESVDAIELAKEKWRALLKGKEMTKAGMGYIFKLRKNLA